MHSCYAGDPSALTRTGSTKLCRHSVCNDTPWRHGRHARMKTWMRFPFSSRKHSPQKPGMTLGLFIKLPWGGREYSVAGLCLFSEMPRQACRPRARLLGAAPGHEHARPACRTDPEEVSALPGARRSAR